jgi:hypothetical protein
MSCPAFARQHAPHRREDPSSWLTWRQIIVKGEDRSVTGCHMSPRRCFRSRRIAISQGVDNLVVLLFCFGVGAGDAFAAGVIAGYLEESLGEGVQMGTVMAALALGISGDLLMTTREEVSAILRREGRSVDR